MRAGDLRERLQFEKRQDHVDGHGNVQSSFVAQFTRWGSLTPMRANETVQASRLAGVLPVTVRVRRDAQTKTIASDWRFVNLRSGETFAVKGPWSDPTARREFLEFPAEKGVAE